MTGSYRPPNSLRIDFGMRAERRNRPVAARLADARRRRRRHAHRPARRADADAPQMRMRAQQSGIVDAGEGDVGGFEFFHQRRGVVRGEHRGDLGVGFVAMRQPLRHGGEFWIAAERSVPQHLVRQHAPFAIVLDGDQDVGAVAGLECPVGRDGRMREPDALERIAVLFVEQRHRHPFRHGVEHGNRNIRALPDARTRDQSFQDCLVGIEASGDVDDRNADARRRLRAAGDRRHARLGLDQQVVGLALRVRPALAVTRDRAADQPRIVLAQARGREAELCQRAGLEVLHEHVGLRQHRLQQRLVVGLAEVEHQPIPCRG